VKVNDTIIEVINMAKKTEKKQRSLSFSIPTIPSADESTNLFLRALNAAADLAYPTLINEEHGTRSKFISHLILKHFFSKGYCNDQLEFNEESVKKAEAEVAKLKAKPKI
jgi:hypothetical protein